MDKTESLPLLTNLRVSDRDFISNATKTYRFTHQEFRILTEYARDLEMWQEVNVGELWKGIESTLPDSFDWKSKKKRILSDLSIKISNLKSSPKHYQKQISPPSRAKLSIVTEDSKNTVLGDCPVASPKTVCCNLKTIDAVENCAYGCSYCTIQTFYGDKVVVEKNLKEKLSKIKLEPNRFYHIGTGQSSDSLVWGNAHGILDDLCEFAERNPNVLLEFKTKSANVSHLLKRDIPQNIVCSWSLNTDTIVNNEEHFTAPLHERISAARKAADKGIKVAFHFHPMVHYDNWKSDYANLAATVQELFDPSEVLFISFGSVTFIKPVIQKIRERGEHSKILQMEMVKDPHGKLTYRDEIKIEMFNAMNDAFSAWHGDVFFYLCMERADIWDAVFGWHYQTNEVFERTFGESSFSKINCMNLKAQNGASS